MYYVKRQGFPLKVTLHNTCTSPPHPPTHSSENIASIYSNIIIQLLDWFPTFVHK